MHRSTRELYHARQTDQTPKVSNDQNNTITTLLPLPGFENHGFFLPKRHLAVIILFCRLHIERDLLGQPTAIPLNILAMASRLVGRYTANLGHFAQEPSCLLNHCHQPPMTGNCKFIPSEKKKHGDDRGWWHCFTVLDSLRNLHLCYPCCFLASVCEQQMPCKNPNLTTSHAYGIRLQQNMGLEIQQ